MYYIIIEILINTLKLCSYYVLIIDNYIFIVIRCAYIIFLKRLYKLTTQGLINILRSITICMYLTCDTIVSVRVFIAIAKSRAGYMLTV